MRNLKKIEKEKELLIELVNCVIDVIPTCVKNEVKKLRPLKEKYDGIEKLPKGGLYLLRDRINYRNELIKFINFKVESLYNFMDNLSLVKGELERLDNLEEWYGSPEELDYRNRIIDIAFFLIVDGIKEEKLEEIINEIEKNEDDIEGEM